MERKDTDGSIHEAALDAIDQEGLARVLELAGNDCDEDAVVALHAVIADTLVADASAAAERARWQGRDITGEDVGTAAEKRRTGRERKFDAMEPASLKWDK